MRFRSGFAYTAALGVAAILAMLAVDGVAHVLMAQNPFGAPRPGAATEPQIGGIVGWILAKQSEFYREISATIRAAKSDGSAVWSLLARSFAYRIFHPPRPRQGKAGVSSLPGAQPGDAPRGDLPVVSPALMQTPGS